MKDEGDLRMAIGMILVLSVVVVLVASKGITKADLILASNDGPLGQISAEHNGGSISGHWNDLNGIGYRFPETSPSISAIACALCGMGGMAAMTLNWLAIIQGIALWLTMKKRPKTMTRTVRNALRYAAVCIPSLSAAWIFYGWLLKRCGHDTANAATYSLFSGVAFAWWAVYLWLPRSGKTTIVKT